jgi:hypothetical protein
LGQVNGSADDEFLASDAQLVLLKFADGMVHTGNIDPSLVPGCIPIMQELVKIRVPRFFNAPEAFGEGPIQGLTSATRLLLDIFRAPFVPPQSGTKSYADLSEILIGTLL